MLQCFTKIYQDFGLQILKLWYKKQTNVVLFENINYIYILFL